MGRTVKRRFNPIKTILIRDSDFVVGVYAQQHLISIKIILMCRVVQLVLCVRNSRRIKCSFHLFLLLTNVTVSASLYVSQIVLKARHSRCTAPYDSPARHEISLYFSLTSGTKNVCVFFVRLTFNNLKFFLSLLQKRLRCLDKFCL